MYLVSAVKALMFILLPVLYPISHMGDDDFTCTHC